MSSLQTQFFSPSVSTDLFTFQFPNSKVQTSSPPLPSVTSLTPSDLALAFTCSHSSLAVFKPVRGDEGPPLSSLQGQYASLQGDTQMLAKLLNKLVSKCPPWIPLFLQLFHFFLEITVHYSLYFSFLITFSEKLIKNTSILSHRLLVSLL